MIDSDSTLTMGRLVIILVLCMVFDGALWACFVEAPGVTFAAVAMLCIMALVIAVSAHANTVRLESEIAKLNKN